MKHVTEYEVYCNGGRMYFVKISSKNEEYSFFPVLSVYVRGGVDESKCERIGYLLFPNFKW